MKTQEQSTKERLLEVACEVFAEKGYRDATVADICSRAGANVAAVNYYFHDKASLYAEAWGLAFQRSLEAYPPDGGVPADAPPERRLRGRVGSLLRRMADPQGYAFEIINKEMVNPTGLLSEAIGEKIEPMRKNLQALVRELLGPEATDRQVQLCQRSILSQCMDPMVSRRRRQSISQVVRMKEDQTQEADVEALADHITRFSLAGIAEIRRKI